MARRAGLLLAILVVAAVGVVGGLAMAAHVHGSSGATAGTSAPAAAGEPTVAASSVASAPTVDAAGRAGSAASRTADPMSGQALATDPPVVVTTPKVAVQVTFFGWDPTARRAQVGGYAANVVEAGGTCTLTLTKGSATATGTSQARADASTTTCGAVTVPGDRLSPGTWQAVLSYSSPHHAGVAAPVSIEVTP